MNSKNNHDERMAKMSFATVYPLYVTKIEKKGRTKKELNEVIEWLTGYNEKKIQSLIDSNATFETFFMKAKLNPNAELITGLICGYRIEEIENPLTKKVVLRGARTFKKFPLAKVILLQLSLCQDH